MDCINPSNKNQTAKVLEKFFYVSNGKDYISVIPNETEQIEKLPTLDEIKENIDRTVSYAKEIILNADKYVGLDENVLKQYVCGLDPFLDKILAINIADMLDKQSRYSNMEQLKKAWVSSLDDFKTEWKKGFPENTLLFPQANIGGIDTSKLEIGMTVKNYKVLCELLGQEVKGGDSRKAQLDDFKCYFDWEKSGQKFIISDIYDTPLTKEDKRKLGNNSIYVQCIEVILLQYLSKQEGYTRTFTKRNWWEMLGIVNHKYGRATENDLKNLDYTITAWEVRHFYQRCNKKLEQILFSALNSLKNRKLITYEVQTVIVTIDKKGNENHFAANDIQKKQILEVERYVLHSVMGYEKMFQVFIKFQQADFYNKVNEILNQQYGWKHYYKQIKVIYTYYGIKEALPELETRLQKELLNKKVVDFLNNNAKKLYEKNKEEYQKYVSNLISDYWGEMTISETKKSRPWNPPDTYLDAQSILTDELIKIGHRDKKFSMNDFIESNSDIDEMFLL